MSLLVPRDLNNSVSITTPGYKPKPGDRFTPEFPEEVRIRLADGTVAQVKWTPQGFDVIKVFDDDQQQQSPPPPPQPSIAQQMAEAAAKQQAAAKGHTDKLLELMQKIGVIPSNGFGGTPEQKKSSLYGNQTQMAMDAVFKARLSSIMTDNKYDRRLRGRTRGNLDMTRLYKAKLNQNSVFTQKESRRGKQYNVVLVVDESGSMGGGPGSRRYHAAQVAQFLAQHFDKVDGIDLAIIGFGSDIHVHKTFEQHQDLDRVYGTVMSSDGGGTQDLPALQEAYRMLKNRPGQSLVLLLTDGEGHPADIVHHHVHAHPDIKTFGIGIKRVAHQIPEHNRIRVDNLAELKPKIINLLRKHITRG